MTTFPLSTGSHRDVTAIRGRDGGMAALVIDTAQGPATLKDPAQFVGYAGDGGKARSCCATTGCTSIS